MGFLNILSYIGVGLAAAGILMLISYLWSRPKETVLYEDGTVNKQRGEGSWGVTFIASIFEVCIIAALLLYNLAHFSVLKSIGLGLLSGIAMVVVLLLGTTIITRETKFTDSESNKHAFVYTIINSLLNGAGFAVLAAVWGWF